MSSKKIQQYAIASSAILRNTGYFLSIMQTKNMLEDMGIQPDNINIDAPCLKSSEVIVYWLNKISKLSEFIGLDMANTFNADELKSRCDGKNMHQYNLQSLICQLNPTITEPAVLTTDEVDEDFDGYYVGKDSPFYNTTDKKYEDYIYDIEYRYYSLAPQLSQRNLVVINNNEKETANSFLNFIMNNYRYYYINNRGKQSIYLIKTTKAEYELLFTTIYRQELEGISNILIYIDGDTHYTLIRTHKDVSKLNHILKKISNKQTDFEISEMLDTNNISINWLGAGYSNALSGLSSSTFSPTVQKRKGQWRNVGTALKNIIDVKATSGVGFSEFEKADINSALAAELTEEQSKKFINKLNEKNIISHDTFDGFIKMSNGEDYLTIAIDDSCKDETFTIYHNVPIDIDKNPPWNSYEVIIGEIILNLIRWSVMVKNNRPIYLAIKSISESIPGGHYVIRTNELGKQECVGNIISANFYCLTMANNNGCFIPNVSTLNEMSLTTVGFAIGDKIPRIMERNVTLFSKILARKINLFSFNELSGTVAVIGLYRTYIFTPKYNKEKNHIEGCLFYTPENDPHVHSDRLIEICLDNKDSDIVGKIDYGTF